MLALYSTGRRYSFPTAHMSFLQRPLANLVRISQGLASRWRNAWLRQRGVQIRGYCWLRKIEIPRNPQQIRLESCSLDRGVILLAVGDDLPEPKIIIGEGTYVNRHTFIDASESIVIGRLVGIGPGVYITDHDHGTASMSSPMVQPLISKPTRIEDNAWIGAHAIILKGVTIGRGAVVGAGSVVTKSVPAGVRVYGVPAREATV
jgi:acetyltransferase-like isoleucine patch superfamily enzyme